MVLISVSGVTLLHNLAFPSTIIQTGKNITLTYDYTTLLQYQGGYNNSRG